MKKRLAILWVIAALFALAACSAQLPASDTEQTQEVPLGIVSKQTQMREMLQAGINKNEIAERLGISRATLYRWIEKCDLKEHVHKARS